MAAIKINFDASNLPENPTFALANRSGEKLGLINARNIVVKDCMNDKSEVSFVVNKYLDGKLDHLWNKIKDFRLVYCKELNMWFEATVTVDESNETKKNVACVQLGQAELSQISLYGIEINNENDPNWDETKANQAGYSYKNTILFDSSHRETSLLNRLLEKAPHYSIAHVDPTIVNIQRTFSFDGVSIYDAFQQVAEEINCLFVYHSDTDENGKIRRAISVYDLETNCLSCGYRGEFTKICPKCNSTNIKENYGKDTSIFVTADELGKNINFSADTDSTKNCFKLEAGDDIMTAAIRNCNPNGSDYIWCLTDTFKEDMSDELTRRLKSYDDLYEYYQNTNSVSLNSTLVTKYNQLVDKYKNGNNSLGKITNPVIGYVNLMQEYYKAIDMEVYLESGLLPTVTLSSTNATTEAAKLTRSKLSPVSVTSIKDISLESANNAVLSVAKCLVNSNYQVKVNTSSLSGTTWTGNFVVTNYGDENDTSNSSNISITIDENYENFVAQKIKKTLAKEKGESDDIVTLFDKGLDSFKTDLRKYNLKSLTSFYNICQSCVEILVSEGIADKKAWSKKTPNLYNEIYLPYYNKLKAIQSEQKTRQSELDTVKGVYDVNGNLKKDGIETIIEKEKNNIQKALDFKKYLGDNLWYEFCAYRREDVYSNQNYISDGLSTSELFDNALKFLERAKKEIYKSANLQHSITATLQNLLVIDKFKPIVNYFEVGNWIRVQIDNNVYKLRLLEYEIDYDNLEDLSVTFSDVMKVFDGYSDQQSILKQASSMATSYDSVQRQADKGSKANSNLENWVAKGLALTKTKIIDSADNQNMTFDEHGLLCREYLPITDEYDKKQLKIINKGLYVTDDDWETSKAGIGNFTFYNPQTEQIEEGYGVIADTIIGNIILSENVGVYNTNNSIVLDKDGLTITADARYGRNDTAFSIKKKVLDSSGSEIIKNVMYINANGELVLNGSIRIQGDTEDSLNGLFSNVDSKINDVSNKVDGVIDQIPSAGEIDNMAQNKINEVYVSIREVYDKVTDETNRILNDYQADLGQYLQYSPDVGLVLGATSSEYKTVIDNRGLYLKYGDRSVAYITNSQLYVPDAVIENTLTLGKFFFSPREDGGVSLTWQN